MSKKKRCHSERTRLGRRQDVAKSCFNCEHFLYCGDGDHVCDLETSAGAIVQPLMYKGFKDLNEYLQYWEGIIEQ